MHRRSPPSNSKIAIPNNKDPINESNKTELIVSKKMFYFQEDAEHRSGSVSPTLFSPKPIEAGEELAAELIEEAK